MPASSLHDLYVNKLQLIYDAEQQALQAMPQLTSRVQNDDLRSGLEAHRRQTEEQVRRLEQVFRRLGQTPQRRDCLSMRALIQEAQQMTGQIQDPDTLDAFVIAAAQAIEHHEIAAYGTARTWALQSGNEDDADILERTLQEEKGTDTLLSDIAERMVNPSAAEGRASSGERDVTPGAHREAPAGGSAFGGTSPEVGRDAETEDRSSNA